jgi:hypothetical protein
MRASLVGLAAAAVYAGSAAAQTLEVTSYTLHNYSPGKQFEVTRLVSGPSGVATRGYLGYQQSTTGVGARLTLWPVRRLGLELSLATRSGLRSVLERIPNDPEWYGQGWQSTVNETGLRVAVRAVNRPGGRLQFAAGVTRLTFGGLAYYEAVDSTPLVRRTVTGGAFGASWITRIKGRLMASVGLDDIVYHVMPTTRPGDTVRRWTQHDIALSTAFVFRVH